VSGGSTTTDNENFIRRLSDHMLTYTFYFRRAA
jgi:hypothetical protein